MPCPVCQQHQVKNIDRALLADAAPTSLNRKFGVSVEALQHHWQHLQHKMARVDRRFA